MCNIVHKFAANNQLAAVHKLPGIAEVKGGPACHGRVR